MTPETLAFRELRGKDLTDAMMASRWYPQPDDLIGGWCVMPVDEPPSGGCFAVADFISQEIAEHIAELHNASLEKSS